MFSLLEYMGLNLAIISTLCCHQVVLWWIKLGVPFTANSDLSLYTRITFLCADSVFSVSTGFSFTANSDFFKLIRIWLWLLRTYQDLTFILKHIVKQSKVTMVVAMGIMSQPYLAWVGSGQQVKRHIHIAYISNPPNARAESYKLIDDNWIWLALFNQTKPNGNWPFNIHVSLSLQYFTL